MTVRQPSNGPSGAPKPPPPSNQALAEVAKRHEEFVHLKQVKADLGYIPGEVRNEAADRLGVHVEHLGRMFRQWDKTGFISPRPGSTHKMRLPDVFKAQAAFFLNQGVVSETYETLRKAGSIPSSMSLKTFSRRVKEWDPAIRACARGGYRAMVKYQFFNIEHIPHKAYAYGSDHTFLAIMVIPERGTKPVFVWLTTLIDFKTRVVLAYKLTIHTPTAEDSLAVFIEGVRGWTTADGVFVGGKPQFLRTDRGGDYISDLMSKNLFDLGVDRQFTQPYSSHQNGRTEALNGTIDEEFAPKMPGFFAGGEDEYTRRVLKTPLDPASLMTLETLDTRMADWFSEYNNRPHSQLGGQSPLEAWAADETFVGRASSTSILNAMPFSETRTLHKYGIEIRSRKYSHPTLAVLRKQGVSEVEVRYHEHDFDMIEVFVDGHHKCTAIRDGVQPEHHRLGVLSVRRAQRLLAERLTRQANYDRVVAERERMAEDGVPEAEWPPLPTIEVRSDAWPELDQYDAALNQAVDLDSTVYGDEANVSGIPGMFSGTSNDHPDAGSGTDDISLGDQFPGFSDRTEGAA